MKHIVIVTTGSFPEGDSISFRLRMVGKAMLDGGYKVSVLCRGKLRDKGVADGIDYISLKYRVGNSLVKLYERMALPVRVKKYLKKHKGNIDCLYLYCGQTSIFKVCKRFAKNNGVKLVRDCPDRFSPEHYKFGQFNPVYRMNDKINTTITDESFDIVAISHYLENYFSGKGLKTVYVPVLCDSSERVSPKKENHEKLTLFYAGDPGKKDYIGNLLEAALLLTEEERKKLRIIFVGVTRKKLEGACGISPEVIDASSEFLEIHGRVPREKVLEMMEIADFVALPRDASARYAKAGFPSKVTESLANATPMLCNISSDLAEYLTDGENAIIARDHTPEAFAEAMSRAIKLTPEEKNIMSKKALDSARELLDYHLYTEKIKEIIG